MAKARYCNYNVFVFRRTAKGNVGDAFECGHSLTEAKRLGRRAARDAKRGQLVRIVTPNLSVYTCNKQKCRKRSKKLKI